MELYINERERVRIGKVLSEKCEIGRGKRQGCRLSALLYILYDERKRQGCPLSALLYILYDEAMIKKTVNG